MKLFLISVFILFTSLNCARAQSDTMSIIGSLQWIHIFNSETNEISPVETITMGLSKEVKTEFKTDSIFIEYKQKLSGEGFASTQGLWYIDTISNTLMMKPKAKWIASKIIHHTKDSIVIELMKPLNLLMIRID